MRQSAAWVRPIPAYSVSPQFVICYSPFCAAILSAEAVFLTGFCAGKASVSAGSVCKNGCFSVQKILLYTEMCILYNILVLYDKNIAQIPCFRVIFTNIYSDRPAVRGVDLLTFAIDDCIIDCEPVHIMNDAFWLL